jgi:hypothetical protein
MNAAEYAISLEAVEVFMKFVDAVGVEAAVAAIRSATAKVTAKATVVAAVKKPALRLV